MSFSKITLEKPIPVSPLIALDRERCILCYRCTRFSSDVAEDNQLVARNRGAHTEITTFADDPYRAPFSGNVIELCPVGALTSTQYRFEARPWDIQNVPTVCGLCSVGCNVNATVREGKVKRILSRNHPEVDGGWLCDKGRFSYPHVHSEDRITEPLVRGRVGLEAVTWEAALDRAEELLRSAGTRVVTALSGSETVEQAFALARLLRGGVGAHAAVLPESTSDALDAFRLPLSALAQAQVVVIVGDDEIADRAPVVDLWLKAAKRNGAEIAHYGPTGNQPTPPGGAAAALHALSEPGNALGTKLRDADRAVLIWSGSGGGGGARLAEAAHALGFEGKAGSGAFHLPATPNARGVACAWAAAADEDETDPEPIGLLIVSGDEAAADPSVRALAEHAESVIAVTMFHGLAVGWADLVLPATSYLERDGTMMNLEGRLQRLRRAVIAPVPDELAWISRLAERFGVQVSPHSSVVFDELSPLVYGGVDGSVLNGRAGLPGRMPYAAPAPAAETGPPLTAKAAGEHFLGELRLVRYRPLFSGPFVERVGELDFHRVPAEVELAPTDAERRAIATGDTVVVRSNGTSVELRARVNRRLVDGVARIASDHAGELHPLVEVVKA
jgi:NADH-quinone oxidoreductase subunit G